MRLSIQVLEKLRGLVQENTPPDSARRLAELEKDNADLKMRLARVKIREASLVKKATAVILAAGRLPLPEVDNNNSPVAKFWDAMGELIHERANPTTKLPPGMTLG